MNDHDGDIYLVGYPLTASQVDSGGEVGQIFTVSRDDTNLLTSAEGQTPSSFGPVVAIDFHDFYPGDVGFQPDATAYIAPLGSTVPEPASLTLLLSGLAAGLLVEGWLVRRPRTNPENQSSPREIGSSRSCAVGIFR